MTEELDGVLAALLRDQVDSYEKLDVVLLVRSRQSPVHLHDIATALRVAVSEIERTVSALCSSGLLARHDQDHIRLSTIESSARTVEHLARAFQEQPLPIASHLSRQALRRLRASAAFSLNSRMRTRRSAR